MIRHIAEVLELKSPFIERNINLSNGIQACDIWTRGADNFYFAPHHHRNSWGLPFEAAVKINGSWLEVGPHSRKNILWKQQEIKFKVVNVNILPGESSDIAEVACSPVTANAPEIEVSIIYEIGKQLPFLRKSVKVKNISESSLTVNNICPEIMYQTRVERNIKIFHDYRMETRAEVPLYQGYVHFQFPEDIDYELGPGEVVESFNLYEIFVSDDPQAASIWQSKVLKHLAPWAAAGNKIKFQISNVKPENNQNALDQIKELVNQCAEIGIEQISFFVNQIWENIGDYEIRRDIFPKGENDLKALFDYIHSKDIEVGVYCSYSIAWHDSKVRKKHLDWECRDKDGRSFDPGTFGNMCFLSAWGSFILNKFDWILDKLGVDYLDFDGPTDIPCYADSHDHSSLGDYYYKSWLWEKKLFSRLNERNVNFTIPRGINYILMGAHAIPGGYTEEDFCHSSGIQLLTNYRAGMASCRSERPAWASWGFLAVGDYHGNSIEYSEEEPLLLSHGLASLLGYGNSSFITGNRCYPGAKTKEVFHKWIEFYRQNREILNGDSLVLAVPDGKNVDGIIYFAENQALAVFFNPSDKLISRNVLIPLRFTGISTQSEFVLEDGCSSLNLETDSYGNAMFKVELEAYKIKICTFKKRK